MEPAYDDQSPERLDLEGESASTAEDQGQREPAAQRTELVHLASARRREREPGEVEGVEAVPSLDEAVAEGAEAEESEEEGCGELQSSTSAQDATSGSRCAALSMPSAAFATREA